MTDIKINTEDVLKKFRSIEYNELNAIFRQAIKDSLQILKKQTESNLNSIPVNVKSPIHKKDKTYPALINGVILEMGMDGTKGRVRIANASKDGYGVLEKGVFALKWFEMGTTDRYQKGEGYHEEPVKKGGGGRTHRNKGKYMGKLPKSGEGYGFFDKAFNSSADEVNKALEENVSKAIQKIMER